MDGGSDGEAQLARFKERKQAAVQDDPDDAVVRNIVDFYRAGQPAASVIVFDGDPAAMLQVVKIGGMMLVDVDEVWIATDTFGSVRRKSPLTGKRWAPQEMSKVFADGRFPGVVFEQLTVMRARREKPVEQWTLVYERGISPFGTPTIIWKKQGFVRDGEGVRMSGRVPDTLRESMQRAPMSEAMTKLLDPAEFGLTDPQEIEGHRDSAAGKMLMAAVKCMVLLFPRSKTAAKIVDTSFNDRTLADFRAGVMAGGDELAITPQMREQMRTLLYGSGERSEWDVLAMEGL